MSEEETKTENFLDLNGVIKNLYEIAEGLRNKSAAESTHPWAVNQITNAAVECESAAGRLKLAVTSEETKPETTGVLKPT